MMNFSMRQLTACVATAAVAGVCVPDSQAVVVTITSGVDSGLVVFDSAGFENDTVGSVPSATTPAGTGWSGSAIDNNTTAVLTGATSGGPSSAYSGANYINNDRNQSSAILNGTFSRNINAQAESFKVEYVMWMDVGTDDSTLPPQAYFFISTEGTNNSSPSYTNFLAGYGMRYTADPDQGGTPELMKYRVSGSGPNYGASTQSLATPPTWTPGEWNTVLFEWDSVTEKAMLTVNDQAAVDVTFAFSNGTSPSNYVIPTDLRQFQIRANNQDSNVFIDSVPEPSSMLLMGLGGLLVAARRREQA